MGLHTYGCGSGEQKGDSLAEPANASQVSSASTCSPVVPVTSAGLVRKLLGSHE